LNLGGSSREPLISLTSAAVSGITTDAAALAMYHVANGPASSENGRPPATGFASAGMLVAGIVNRVRGARMDQGTPMLATD
jgi:hypothetical protein